VSHYSCARGRRDAARIRCGVFLTVCRANGWGGSRKWWYAYVFNRRISIKLEFLVGLVVGVS
jgi:hypothetical protein